MGPNVHCLDRTKPVSHRVETYACRFATTILANLQSLRLLSATPLSVRFSARLFAVQPAFVVVRSPQGQTLLAGFGSPDYFCPCTPGNREGTACHYKTESMSIHYRRKP